MSAITLHQSPSWGPGTVLNFTDGSWTRNGQPVEDYGSIRAAVFTASPTSVGLRDVVPDPVPESTFNITALEAKGTVLKEPFTKTLRVTSAWPTLADGSYGFIVASQAILTAGHDALTVRFNESVASAMSAAL